MLARLPSTWSSELVLVRQAGIGRGIEDGVGRVENPAGGSGVVLRAEFVANRVGDEAVAAIHHFIEKRRAHRVDMSGREDAAGEEVHRILATAFIVAIRLPTVVKMLPKIRGIDSAILDLGERTVFRVDVVNGEQAGNAVPFRDAGDQAGHPVIAMDQIGPDLRDGMVDHLALERQRDEVVFRPINRGAVIENPVLGQMNPLLR